MPIKDKGLIKVAGYACAKNIGKSRAHPTGHFEDVTPCSQEMSVGNLDDELTDSLLYLIAKVISGSIYSIAIGMEVSINCIPDCSHMRIDNTMECMKIWRNKTSNATTALLMEIVNKAVLANDVDGSIMNFHIDAEQLNSKPTDRLLLAISSEVVNREIFIIGHLGLSQTEYDDNPSVTKHSQIMNVLKKWRQEHTDDCSVTEFLECIQRADRDVIYPENVREIKRVVEEYQRDRSSLHTDAVHAEDDQSLTDSESSNPGQRSCVPSEVPHGPCPLPGKPARSNEDDHLLPGVRKEISGVTLIQNTQSSHGTHTPSGSAMKQKKQSKESGQTGGVPRQRGGVLRQTGGVIYRVIVDAIDNYLKQQRLLEHDDNDFFLENDNSYFLEDDINDSLLEKENSYFLEDDINDYILDDTHCSPYELGYYE